MLNVTANIVRSADGITVETTWSGAKLDRPNGIAWGLKASHEKLAERLVKAVNAGKAFRNAEVKTDVNGASYVAATMQVFGRTMNRDLKRLGF